MSIGKREKMLLIILGVVIYAYLFYTFVWVPVIPQISKKNSEITTALQQKAAMDKAVSNMDAKRLELDTGKASNERLDQYLLSNANIADSMDYLEKLTKLLGKEITDVNISKPEEKSTTVGLEGTAADKNKNNGTGRKFYELAIDFKTRLTYAEAASLVKYIEGGSLKIRISKFIVQPPKSVQQGQAADSVFEVGMTIDLYSLNSDNIDKIYEYSRDKFNRYFDDGAIPFTPTEVGKDGVFDVPKQANAGNNSGTVLNIKEESYLAAGDNLRISGTDESNGFISIKTMKRQEIRVNIGESSYTVETAGSDGKTVNMRGGLLQGDLNIQVNVDFPMVKENNDLGLDIKITNNSSRKVNVILSDKAERAKIFDRSGSPIAGTNEKEKVQIM